MYLLLNKKGFYKLVLTEYSNNKKVKHYYEITQVQAMALNKILDLKIYESEK